MSKFTPEDLVQYLYKETSEHKTAAIRVALETDWDLHESFEQIASSLKNLEKFILSPRNEVVNKILQHISNKQSHLFSH